MSFPLQELRKLFAPQDTTLRGTVVSVSDGFARVATKNGLVVARYTGAVSPNDRVLVSNGFASLTAKPSQVHSV